MDPLLNLSIIRKNMLIVEFLKTIKNSKIYRKYLEGTIEIENVNDYLVISKYYKRLNFIYSWPLQRIKEGTLYNLDDEFYVSLVDF